MDWVMSRAEACAIGTSYAKNKKDAIHVGDILRCYDAIRIGDKIQFIGQRGGQFCSTDSLYKNIKGRVLYKHTRHFVIDTGKWRTCINYVDLMKAKAEVRINGKVWLR